MEEYLPPLTFDMLLIFALIVVRLDRMLCSFVIRRPKHADSFICSLASGVDKERAQVAVPISWSKAALKGCPKSAPPLPVDCAAWQFSGSSTSTTAHLHFTNSG